MPALQLRTCFPRWLFSQHFLFMHQSSLSRLESQLVTTAQYLLWVSQAKQLTRWQLWTMPDCMPPQYWVNQRSWVNFNPCFARLCLPAGRTRNRSGSHEDFYRPASVLAQLALKLAEKGASFLILRWKTTKRNSGRYLMWLKGLFKLKKAK